MADRLISVPAARSHIDATVADPILKACMNNVLDSLPAVDAVKVVRCKDCNHCRTASWGERFCARKQADGVCAELSNLREYDFCSYGERR